MSPTHGDRAVPVSKPEPVKKLEGIVETQKHPPHAEFALKGGAGGASGAGTFSDFIYNGGPVINNPQVFACFVGDWSSTANQNRAARLGQFLTDLMSSTYMNILSQYGCGSSGTLVNSVFISSSDHDLSATDIQNILQNAINGSTIPEPTTPNNFYILFLDDATAVNDTAAGATMCESSGNDAFGFHDSFITTAGNACIFGVIPGLTDSCLTNSCAHDSTCSLKLAETQEQRQTQVTSHEFSEAISNPRVGTSNEAWSRPGNPHENGDICNGEQGTITVGSNTWTVQQMYSKFDDMASNGATTCVLGPANPLPSLLPALTVILDRSTFGKDEIDALLFTANPGVIDAAFYVAVDGFTPADLGITSASLSGVPNVAPTLTFNPNIPGMTASPTALVADDPSLSGAIQRFTWVYQISFNSTAGFPAAVGGVTNVLVSASIARVTSPVVTASGSAIMQLIHEPNPYELDGATSWLSTDLRVFQINAGDSKFGVSMGSTPGDAPSFIQNVVNNLNAGTTGGQTFEGNISTDENASALELSEQVSGTPVFNFAVAKVRYRSLATDAPNVRVFFRLFPVSTTSTQYDQSTSYRRGGSGGVTIPLIGIQGGAISTIPCFAEARIDTTTQSMDAQTDPTNVRSTLHDASGAETSAYFGCWLDINQPSQPLFPLNPSPVDGPFTGGGLQTIQQLIRNAHQCLVAEIAFDPDPIPGGSTPGGSDKLAQRNLSIVASDNPGSPASHRIPDTFEVKRTPVFAELKSGPDELLVDSRAVPAGSEAQLFISGETADRILQLADERYVSHHLTKVDDHMLKFPAGGVTYVPIPSALGPNLPGLLTLDLPPTVRKGQAFKVVVRQLTAAAGEFFPPPPPPPPIGSGRGAGVKARQPDAARKGVVARWRSILGSYQVSIPVRTAEVLLEPEERLLAVLKWIQLTIPSTDRWFLVFNRYVQQIGDRVRALGGDPDQIQPSPSGQGKPRPSKERCFTGKVCEVIFDCFGDFEGFVVEDCDERYSFKSHEKGVRRLVMEALKDRLTITVCTGAKVGRIERITIQC